MTQEVRLASGVIRTTDRPIIELADFQAEAKAAGWRFVCPRCGNIASAADFKAIGADGQLAAQECIGRAGGNVDRDALKDADNPKPCDWAAYGLLGTLGQGVFVRLPDGKVIEAFAIAPQEGPT